MRPPTRKERFIEWFMNDVLVVKNDTEALIAVGMTCLIIVFLIISFVLIIVTA